MLSNLLHSKTIKFITVYLIATTLIFVVLQPLSYALPVTTNMMTGKNRPTNIKVIQKALEQKLVASKLESLGLNQKETMARISLLNDKQLNALAQKANSVNAGGDVLGFVIAILIIAILVIVILQLTNHKIIIRSDR